MSEMSFRPWSDDGELAFCPHCDEAIHIPSIQAPGLHFACPACGREIMYAVAEQREIETTERLCSVCGSEMVKRKGKYGEFWGCSAYSRSNPCKGKSTMKTAVRYEIEYYLVPFVKCDDDEAARYAKAQRHDERKQYYQKEWWR